MAYYGTVAEADTYHAARGRADWAALSSPEKEQALQRGADYVDGAYLDRINGKMIAYDQERAWPRSGATTYDGIDIPDSVTPQGWINAAYEAAYLEALSPGTLTPVSDSSVIVTEETIGPITTKYEAVGEGASAGQSYTAIEQHVARYLQAEAPADTGNGLPGGQGFWA